MPTQANASTSRLTAALGWAFLPIVVIGLFLVYLIARTWWAMFRPGRPWGGVIKLPAWDEVVSRPPVTPPPRFLGPGIAGKIWNNWCAKRILREGGKLDRADAEKLGEFYEIGTNLTPVNKATAAQWYKKAIECGGAPSYAELRLAEMCEDADGIEPDTKLALELYEKLPITPEAFVFFAIREIQSGGQPANYVSGYKFLLLADRYYSWSNPTLKELRTNIRYYRENIRHIKVREIMSLMEPKMKPEHLIAANQEARTYWRDHNLTFLERLQKTAMHPG